MHRIATNSLTSIATPLSRECLLGFDSGFQHYTDSSALGVMFQSASCGCPGRASGRGRKSRMLDYVKFALDAEPPPPAALHHPNTSGHLLARTIAGALEARVAEFWNEGVIPQMIGNRSRRTD